LKNPISMKLGSVVHYNDCDLDQKLPDILWTQKGVVAPASMIGKRPESLLRPGAVLDQTAVAGNGFGQTRDKFGTEVAPTGPRLLVCAS